MSRPSQPIRPPIRPGTILADRYAVVDVVGEGGMGIVYECKHLKLGTRVAVKMLLDDAAEDAEVRVRFDREARAAARLKSPHVAHVLDVDETAEGRPFMVMEFLDGYGLDEVVDSGKKIDVTEAVDYILQASSGMAEAHAMGVVHRDLKPPNLFCAMNAGEARVKVLDFGIAKALLPGDLKGVTHTTTTFGTPTYMSPEQIQSAKNVDGRADIWSLGVILYELLIGVPPFDGENAGAIIWSICSTSPEPPHVLRPDVPRELSEIVMLALEKNREDRYQSVIDFAEALEPFGTPGIFQVPARASSLPRASRPSYREASSMTTGNPASAKRETNAPWTTSRRLSIRRTQTALVLGVVTMVLIIGGGVALLSMRGGDGTELADPARTPTVPQPDVEPAGEPVPVAGPAVSTAPTASAPPDVSAAAPDPEGSASAASEAPVERPRPPASPPITHPTVSPEAEPSPPVPKTKPPPAPPGRDPVIL